MAASSAATSSAFESLAYKGNKYYLKSDLIVERERKASINLYSLSETYMSKVEEILNALNQESGLSLQITFKKQTLVPLLEEERAGVYEDK